MILAICLHLFLEISVVGVRAEISSNTHYVFKEQQDKEILILTVEPK